MNYAYGQINYPASGYNTHHHRFVTHHSGGMTLTGRVFNQPGVAGAKAPGGAVAQAEFPVARRQ